MLEPCDALLRGAKYAMSIGGVIFGLERRMLDTEPLYQSAWEKGTAKRRSSRPYRTQEAWAR